MQLRQGKSIRDVSHALDIFEGAVKKIRNKDKENISEPRQGRPLKVSKEPKR
ncbi:hypothetical protein BGZ50_000677, partial [Haplosporangium sp. Z 11]